MTDLRYAIRSLRAAPGFTVVALLTLALGIGATSAIFTVVNSVLLRPLPFHESKNLFVVVPTRANGSRLSDQELDEYQKHSRSIEQIAGVKGGGIVTLLGAGEPATVRLTIVTSNFWPLLGVQPALGRFFSAADGDAAVLSDRLWRTRFAADRSVLGRAVKLDGVTFVVVGVMPPAFDYPRETGLWTHLELHPESRGDISMELLARPRPGVSQGQAEADLSAIASGLTNRSSARPSCLCGFFSARWDSCCSSRA